MADKPNQKHSHLSHSLKHVESGESLGRNREERHEVKFARHTVNTQLDLQEHFSRVWLCNWQLFLNTGMILSPISIPGRHRSQLITDPLSDLKPKAKENSWPSAACRATRSSSIPTTHLLALAILSLRSTLQVCVGCAFETRP